MATRRPGKLAPFWKRRSWPARTVLRRATAGCSFVFGRGLPASNTLRPKAGVMQPWYAVRIIRAAAAHSRGTAPTHARPRPVRASPAGTVPRATPRSACCRTVWRRGCRARSPNSRTPWPPRYRRGAHLAARDGRAAASRVADAARLRPPPCSPWASQCAVPTTGVIPSRC